MHFSVKIFFYFHCVFLSLDFNMRCDPKSSIAQRDTLDFYIYHIDFGLCDRSQD